MTTPVNVNQLFLPSALQIGPGGELITFDGAGNPVIIDPSVPGSITINAIDVLYDNATSGLTATNVQDAIDEIDATIDGITGGGALDFVDLGDTPADYVGQGGLFVRVNVGETGLEFAAGGGGGATDFLSLTDTPGSYAGQAGQTLIVNPGETGLIFGAASGGVGVAIDTATYTFGVDYDGATDDTLAVPTPPAGSEAELFVFFDGIFQNNTSWVLINGGNDVQFDAAIPATVSEVELRQIVPDVATITINMDDALYIDGVDFTAGGGAEVLALPIDPGTIENIWIYYNGIQQYPDPGVFTLAGTNLNITGVPSGIDEIYVKVGSTAAAIFDIDSLPTAAIASGDLLAFSGASVGGTESATTTAELASVMITEGVGQSFDIDALPPGTADDTADRIAISDQSDLGGTEKYITLSDLGGLIGGTQTLISSVTVGAPVVNVFVTGFSGSYTEYILKITNVASDGSGSLSTRFRHTGTGTKDLEADGFRPTTNTIVSATTLIGPSTLDTPDISCFNRPNYYEFRIINNDFASASLSEGPFFHYIANETTSTLGDNSYNWGYGRIAGPSANSTIDEIQFFVASRNIIGGTFELYGVI